VKIYILRHGQSPSASEAGVATDAQRPLSPRGREDARHAADYMEKNGAKPGIILVSPLVRAQQTAEMAAPAFSGKPPVKTYEPLDNRMSGVDLYRRLIEDEHGAEEILVIGHQPQVGELAHYLTGAFFQFMPAGQVAVDSEGPGRSTLLWNVNPDEIQ
jgi:phosphohistidine phosphatase